MKRNGIDAISKRKRREILARASKNRLVIQPAFCFKTRRPKSFLPVTGRFERELLPWQKDAFRVLASKLLRVVIAPTGCGKSTLAIALGLHDITNGQKVIVAYPQHDISPGFDPMKILVSPGAWSSWAPKKLEDDASLDTEGKVRAIIKFLRDPPSPDMHKRALLCTHSALVFAHKRLSREGGEDDPWKGTSVFLDEGHHSAFEEDDGNDKYEMNGLASVVAHYALHGSGPLALITATWLRTEDTIVPPEVFDQFTRYEYQIESYLESLRYLREIQIRFVVGNQMDALKRLVAAEPHRKTIVYLQTGLAPKAKMKMLGQCKQAVEVTVPARETVDLVDPSDRHRRKDALFNAIRSQIGTSKTNLPKEERLKSTPTIIYALYKFCEGADWPEASRAIMLAPRGSIRMTLQILGRLLRDWPGKTKVHLDIIIPFDLEKEKKPQSEVIVNYFKAILAGMVVDWHFKRHQIRKLIPRGKNGERLRKFFNDPERMSRIGNLIVDKSIGHDGDQGVWDEVSEGIVDQILREDFVDKRTGRTNSTDAEREALMTIIRSHDYSGRMKRASLDVEDIDYTPEMKSALMDVKNPIGLLQYWAVATGQTLKEIRASLGKMRDWSLKLAREKIQEYRDEWKQKHLEAE